MFDTSVPSSSNPFDTAFNPSLMGFGGNSELSDNLTPDLMKNLRLGGASQEVINIESLALATNGSLPQFDTSLTIQSTEALTLDISNSVILSATSSIDPLTGQALAAQTGSNLLLSPVMEQALQLTYDTLTGLASDPDFSTQMNLAFGNSWNPDVASTIAQDFINRNFSELPSVEIFQSAAINGADGAFDSLNNTIYLSNEYITQNAANPEAITSVLLEEIGHYIDSQINISDAPGDEGAIFAKLAQGKALDEQELLALKAEDDTATIMLGGKVIQIEQSSTLEVAQNEDGRLETFAVGTDGEVWQKWQTAPNGYWSNWQQMGFKATEIEVAQNEDGHLEAFAIGTDGEVWQKWQTEPNGYSGWSGWQQMGFKATEIEVAQNEDGRLEALAIGMDGEVWHKWQTAPNGYWGDWEQMGLKATELDVGQNQDGRLEAFAVGMDGEVWQRWQTAPNGYWSNWQQMGFKATDIKVGQNQDGRLETFAVGMDGEVWQKWQTAPNGDWSNWQQMGFKATELDVGQNEDGRLEVVAIGMDGEVWQKWQTAPNAYWSDWQQMGLQATEIELTQNKDGRLEAFAVGIDGEAWQKWQTAPNGYWSNWEKMGLQASFEEGLEEPANYYPELTSITEDQWDEYSGDNTRLGYVYDNFGEVDETYLIPQEYRQSIKDIYIDLSTEVLGQGVRMTAGYMHDKSYYQGVPINGSTGWWHSGIDFAAAAGTTVKSVSGGTIASIYSGNAATNGYFVGVDDGNKIWIYGHLQSPGNWNVGDMVESGQMIGLVGSQLGSAAHLHLAVQTDRTKPANSQRTKARVDEATMSPLQAFWGWKNI